MGHLAKYTLPIKSVTKVRSRMTGVYHVGFLGFHKLYVSSLKRRAETCVDREVKGEEGHKWGPSRLRYDV
jgi:succinate dehydrogenase/fumarate reductase cytochrome b subunit